MRTARGKRRATGGEERAARGRMRTRCDELSNVVEARSAAIRGETRAMFGEVEKRSEDIGRKSRAKFQEKRALCEQEVEVSSIERREDAKATGATAQHEVEGTRTKLQRRTLKARCRERRVLKLPILVWQLSEVKNCSNSGNTHISSHMLYFILVMNTQAYSESLLLCTKKYMNGKSAHVCMHACLMSSKKFGYVVNVKMLEWSWHGENVVYFLYVVDSSSNMLGKFYLGQWKIYEVVCVKSEKICCFLRMDMLKLNLKAVSCILKCKWAWNVRKKQCMGRNFNSCKFVWITKCEEIVCIGEYYADCNSHVWFSSKITRKMLYACAKSDVKICKYDVFVAEILVTYFFSNTSIHLSPQIKLWEGIGVEVKRRKTKVKLCKVLHSSFVLWQRTEKMAAASTTNNDMDLCMMDENKTNSASLKRPKSMAQVTISQKKAKGKLIFESKCPPFWLGFQAMNWTNRAKDYPMDSMELTSE